VRSALLIFLILPAFAFAWGERSHDYSGEDFWYLGVEVEQATADQNLTSTDSLTSLYPRIKVGGVGPQATRFEVTWSRFTDKDADWRISGLDGDIWLPYRPELRIRPYLILGVGYHRYYGASSDYLVSNNADNGARSLNVGLAVIGNISYRTELVAAFRYRYLTWESPEDENGLTPPDADAAVSGLSLGIQRLF